MTPRQTLAALTLALILGATLAAPLYARWVSRTDPFLSAPMRLLGTEPVLAENPGLGTTPIGPGWRGPYLLGPYLLGADSLGRDVAARLLYAGRTSLLVAGAATLLSLALGLLAGLLAGFFGGPIDAALSAAIDLLWAFPVYLLAISLAVILVNEGLHLGPLTLEADSLALPILILGAVFVPYVARPIRAETRTLRASTLLEAATATGGSRLHLLRRHVLPLVLPVLLGLAPVVAAITLLTEAALSVLGLGVQPPGASWGTLIADGTTLLYSRPLVAIAPGLAIVTTVLALNALTPDNDG